MVKKMNLFLTTFLFVLNTFDYVKPIKKCCDLDSYLKKGNSNFFCDRNEDKRLQIFTNELNSFQENTTIDYECFDGKDNITLFKIKNNKVIGEELTDVNFYRKCCPLSYYYNSITHSCVWTNNSDVSFIKQHFIKVGLPQCKVIVDYKLKPDTYYRHELGALLIGESTVFREGDYCIDKDETNSLIARGCYDDTNVCNRTKCLHKCCPDGQSFVDGQHCKNTYIHGLNLSFTDRVKNSQDPFAVIHKYDCKIYILRDKIQYHVDDNGIYKVFYNKTNSFESFPVDEQIYCIEHVKKEELDTFKFFMCFFQEPMQEKFLAARWAKIISCVFIVIVITAYLFLPELLNLFGKILVSYCTAMMANYSLLTYSQFVRVRSDQSCVATSFLSYYASLTSFTWLNVMCFDIWWTFSSTLKSYPTNKKKKNEIKRFLLYSLYGWGVPIILTLTTLLVYKVFDTPWAVTPFLGQYKCYLERRDGNYGLFLYFATPLIFIEITNLVLFVKTIIYCLKVKSEVNRMNDNRVSMKERKININSYTEQLRLILKLSITMGISFIFEVVSSLYDFNQNTVTKYIEVIWDTFNCLQGVFIFLIFICNQRILRMILGKRLGERIRKISLTSTATTSITQASIPLTSKAKNNVQL